MHPYDAVLPGCSQILLTLQLSFLQFYGLGNNPGHRYLCPRTWLWFRQQNADLAQNLERGLMDFIHFVVCENLKPDHIIPP